MIKRFFYLDCKVLLHEETGPLSSNSFLRYTPYQRVRTSSRPTSFHRTPLPLVNFNLF